ncbi:hypothetical protein LY78DRAFT_438180 [Colletotrichum sublineola]|nr:hypothetical protein LY78DRAFT_438180 [Colletotrichum sublineola]
MDLVAEVPRHALPLNNSKGLRRRQDTHSPIVGWRCFSPRTLSNAGVYFWSFRSLTLGIPEVLLVSYYSCVGPFPLLDTGTFVEGRARCTSSHFLLHHPRQEEELELELELELDLEATTHAALEPAERSSFSGRRRFGPMYLCTPHTTQHRR